MGDCIADLETLVGKSIVLLQECSLWTAALDIPGYLCYHTLGLHAAIAIPYTQTGRIRWSNQSERHVVAMMGTVAVVCTYLPDSWKSADEYEHAVSVLRSAMREARRQGARTYILAGDMHVELCPDGTAVGDKGWGGFDVDLPTTLRRTCLSALIDGFKRFAPITFDDSIAYEQQFTRKSWGNEVPSQIDYILVNQGLSCESKLWNTSRFRSSDHYPMAVSVRIQGAFTQKRSIPGKTVETVHRYWAEGILPTCRLSDYSEDLG